MNQGTYTYTVAGVAPCTNASAQVVVTETTSTTWYQDLDGDGFGDPNSSTQSCNQPLGYVDNNNDLCPSDINKIAPGQCGCGVADTDTDGDGTANCNDGCPNDPLKIAPGLCGCGNIEHANGSACSDGNPCTLNDTYQNCVCVSGTTSPDSDGDGTCDAIDGCPNDPLKTAPGLCGCGNVDHANGTSCSDGDPCTLNDTYQNCVCVSGTTSPDSDGDGTCDAIDGCPTDPLKIAAGICGCGFPEPGTACNDNNPNTTGDVIGANCLCAGSTVDCNDNNPCTIDSFNGTNCVHDPAPDTDGDGTCDLTDGCPNDPLKIAPGLCGCGVVDHTNGTACSDGDPCTVGDAYLNCVCVSGTTADTDGDGTCDAQDGCPTDPLKIAPGTCGCGFLEPGATCNDNDPNTTGDVIGLNCLCAGSTVNCNDNDPCTIDSFNGTECVHDPSPDSDSDGTCDAVDECDNDPLKIAPGTCGCGFLEPGATCNDNDPNTTGDVIGLNCLCSGTLANDCNGVAGGPDQPGTACNDNNPCTTVDTWSAACVCTGTAVAGPTMGTVSSNSPICVGSTLNLFSQATGSGTITYSWTGPMFGSNQQNPSIPNASSFNTGTFTVTASNGCGTDATGTTDVVVNYQESAGTNGTLSICSNAAPANLISSLGGSPSTSGSWTFGGNAHGNTYNPATDISGAYLYTVFNQAPCPNSSATVTVTETEATTWYQDSDGDGAGNPAVSQLSCTQPTGYVANSNDGCPSDINKIAPGICGCGSLEPGTGCNDNDPNTTGDVIGANCQCHGTTSGGCTENLTLSVKLDGSPLQTTWALYDATETSIVLQGGFIASQANTTVNVPICVNVGCYHLRVSDSGNNGITNGGYILRDASNRRIIDANGAFTTTSEINTNPNPNRSFCVPVSNLSMLANWCDRTNLLFQSPIYCNAQPGATGYQFWIYDPHGSYNRRVVKLTNSLVPSTLNTDPIPVNTNLNIRVRSLVGTNYGVFGPACRIRFIPNGASGGGGRELIEEGNSIVTMALYPNPNRDGQVNLSMEGLDVDGETMVDIDVYDMLGKRVHIERAIAAEGILNHAMDLRLDEGMYMVNVTINGRLYTQRLVMQ